LARDGEEQPVRKWEWCATVQEGLQQALDEGWEPYAAVYDPCAHKKIMSDPIRLRDGDIIHYLRREYRDEGGAERKHTDAAHR
jgi:hypothetical protein